MVDRNTPRGIRNGIPYDSDSPCYSTLPNILNEASLHGSDRTDNLPSYKAATAQPSAPNYEQALESEPIASRQLEEENLRDDELPGKAERRIPNAQLRKVSIRLNLIKSAKRLLCFLKEIDLLRDLYTGVKVKAALYRYEFLWLPLLAKSLSGPLVSPPLDVHWVWIVHMLSPVHYEKDCLKIVGKILPHRLLSSEALEKSRKQGREAWERRYPCMPWNLTPESILSSLNEQPISQISYGLKDAIKRQSAFYYQVSMPHYTSKAFLYRSVHRYRQFLALKKANPSEFLVPCYDIDIIWHTHLVHPIIYKSDTESLLGGIFPHDDSVNDRSEGSKLVESDSKTRSLWMSAFGTSFRREGAMFRGDPPINYLHSISAKEEESAKLSKFHLQITQVKLIGNFPSGPLKLKLKKENRKLAEFTVFHSDAEDREHNVVDLNLKFTLLQRDLKDWIVLKVQSDRKIGKVLKLFGKGSFWCMSHMEELFRLKTQQTITKVFVDDSSPSSVELEMSARRELTTDWALIGIMTGDFKPHILEPSLLTSRYGMVTSSRSNNQDIYLAEMATHRLLNESDPTMPLVLEVEVFHSRHFLFSAVHLYVDSPGKGRSLVGLAHTIDHNTIPSPAGFKPNASSYDNWTFPTLDLNAGERAMVIKTRGRDWALLIGSWEGMRKGVKGSFSSRGIAGSPGYLKVRIHVPMGKKPVVIVLPYERQIYSFKMTDLHVDMLRGRLQVSNDCPDFVEQVSLGLAITVLHVLCQPRPVVEDTVDAPTSSEDVMTPLPDFAAPRRIPAERLKFLAALGFFCASAPTNTMLARGAASRFGDRAVDSRAASAGHWPFYVVPLTFHPAIDDDVGDTGGCGGCGGGVFETLPPPSNTLWGSSGGTSDSAHGGGGDSADFGDIGGGDGGASVFNALFSAFGGGGDGGGGGGDVGGGGDGGGDGGGCGGCGGCGG